VTTVVVEYRRSPNHSFLIGLVGLTGLLISLGVSDNRVIIAMGEPYATIWGICLTLGAIITLTGTYWRGTVLSGFLVERSGLILLSSGCFLWAILILSRLHLDGLFSAVLTFGFGSTCYLQMRWINKNLDRVMKAISNEENHDL
jgi:hypothetical protein